LNLIRIDACRKCGQELQITRLCVDCTQPLHFDCTNCNMFVDDPIHQHDTVSNLFTQPIGITVQPKEAIE
jgi:predicted amidophosphoribosyltransferase